LKVARSAWKSGSELLRLRFPKKQFGAGIIFYESFSLSFPGNPFLVAWNYLSVDAVKLLGERL
jgi:hypothetical protein